MIVEIAAETMLKYLGYAKDNLDKIKLPLTKDQEKDVTNMTALILAKSNLNAVIINLEEEAKKKEEEYDDIDEDDIFREANDVRREICKNQAK